MAAQESIIGILSGLESKRIAESNMKARTRIRQKLRHYYDLLQFFSMQRLSGFAVPEEPHFDEISTPFFVSLLNDCKLYLEYGSGGSTLVAAKLKKSFVSVDTDRFFLKAVQQRIGPLAADQRLVYVDIGLTGPWGMPLREQHPSRRRLRKWTSYANSPWHLISGDKLPDLILIDGRFRVATALTCCAKLYSRPDATILVDDYSDRPHYSVIEEYAQLTQMVGRMAVFKPSDKGGKKISGAIENYSADWR